MFWHSVIVTLGEVFSAAHRRGRNTFQGLSAEAHIHTRSCSISFRLTFLCSAQNAVWKQIVWNVPHLWGIASEFWRGQFSRRRSLISNNWQGRKWTWWGEGKVAGIEVNCLLCFSPNPPTSWPFVEGGGSNTHFRYNQRLALQLCVPCRISTTDSHTPTCMQALYFKRADNLLAALMVEELWESVSVVLITPTAAEVQGKGLGLVCSLASGAGCWWECLSWSQRSNLP